MAKTKKDDDLRFWIWVVEPGSFFYCPPILDLQSAICNPQSAIYNHQSPSRTTIASPSMLSITARLMIGTLRWAKA